MTEHLLTTYLLTLYATSDWLAGPAGLFDDLRALFRPGGRLESEFVEDVISCPYCAAPYAAAVSMVLPRLVARWLALAGGVVAFYQLLEHIE